MSRWNTEIPFESLVGEIIETYSLKQGDDSARFTTKSGKEFVLDSYHDCCSSVTLEDICGDPEILVGVPILKAEVLCSNQHPETISKARIDDMLQESYIWTFYHLSTIKGTITLRWFGTSNGYYSEEVFLFHENKEDSECA